MSEPAANPALQPLKNPKHEAVLQAWIADPTRVWWKAWQAAYPKSKQRAAAERPGRLAGDDPSERGLARRIAFALEKAGRTIAAGAPAKSSPPATADKE